MKQNAENLFTCGVEEKVESSGKCHFFTWREGGSGKFKFCKIFSDPPAV